MRVLFTMLASLAFLGGGPRRLNDIHGVDFGNFTYKWITPNGWQHELEWMPIAQSEEIRLRKGRWKIPVEMEEGAGARYSGLVLESVEFGRVIPGNREQAIVILRYESGGTQNWHYVYIYELESNQPRLLAYFHTGDRAASGLHNVYAKQSNLVVELYDPEKKEGDCCSSGYLRTRYRWSDNNFEKVGPVESGRAENVSRLPVSTFGIHKEIWRVCLLTIIMTIDKIVVMKNISISEFKAKCLGLIEQVDKTRQPLRITRHGRPVAELIPAGPDRKRKFLGDMAGTVEILGDIVSPVIDLEEFEAYRD